MRKTSNYHYIKEKNIDEYYRKAIHVGKGLMSLVSCRSGRLIIGFILLVTTFIAFRLLHADNYAIIEQYCRILFLILLELTVLGLFCWYKGYGFIDQHIRKSFEKINFMNNYNLCPILSDITYKGNEICLYFISSGLPKEAWETYKSSIENVLDVSIRDIKLGMGQDRIILNCVRGVARFPSIIPYKTIYDNYNEYNIPLGSDLLGSIVVLDLSKDPHVLIGGASGCGKSQLVKNIVNSAISKKYIVYIADLKGGLDFFEYQQSTTILTDSDVILRELLSVVDEMNERKQLFSEVHVNSIYSYSHLCQKNMPHILFVFDEFAMLLDKTALDKDTKNKVLEIERQLNDIARLGRAFGIHLLMCAQRPDSDCLSGQIKANLSTRICGKADAVLSRIILDSTDAADKIPKDEPGVFLMNNEILFKSFYCIDTKH